MFKFDLHGDYAWQEASQNYHKRLTKYQHQLDDVKSDKKDNEKDEKQQ